MAKYLELEEIKQKLILGSIEDVDIFPILKKIAVLINNPQNLNQLM